MGYAALVVALAGASGGVALGAVFLFVALHLLLSAGGPPDVSQVLILAGFVAMFPAAGLVAGAFLDGTILASRSGILGPFGAISGFAFLLSHPRTLRYVELLVQTTRESGSAQALAVLTGMVSGVVLTGGLIACVLLLFQATFELVAAWIQRAAGYPGRAQQFAVSRPLLFVIVASASLHLVSDMFVDMLSPSQLMGTP